MSAKPNFIAMATQALRAYVLEHRDDEKALHAYLDRRHSEHPNLRVYKAEDDVSEAIAEYLKSKRQQQAS